MIQTLIENHLSKVAHREGAFRFIHDELCKLGRSVLIVETGCARQKDNYAGDGQSTFFWDLILQKIGGAGFTCDINPEATSFVNFTGVKRMSAWTADSVMFLRDFQFANQIDFLYLDSFDFEFGKNDSAIHHLAELTAIFSRLKSGCMIAVDDCHSDIEGKHIEVKKFLKGLGVEPGFESYVTVWKKAQNFVYRGAVEVDNETYE